MSTIPVCLAGKGPNDNRKGSVSAFTVVLLQFLLAVLCLDVYIDTGTRGIVANVTAPVVLPARGEVLVTWPVLLDQLDKHNPVCKVFIEKTQQVLDMRLFGIKAWWFPVPARIWDTTLLDFKGKARRAGCIVLDKGEKY